VIQEITPYERAYTKKVSIFGFFFLLLHLPILCVVAMANSASPILVALVMIFLLAGPALILMREPGGQLGAPAIAIAAMGTSALAIYVSNGMIEAHFELFVLIAMLTVYGRIAPLLLAGGTIALHHVVFWVWLPTHIFNYKASFSIVLLHAFFVVLEVVPACWIARQLGRAIKAQGIVVENLGGAAEQITAAAAQISSSTQSLAQGASQQAASIEETSASTEQINSMATRNSDNSRSAATIVSDAAVGFAGTNTSLAAMVDAMNEIRDSSEKIADIIKSIDQISFQTRILALNAAVEAARAGEFGKSFGVVADEVGNLAVRCAQAASDTATLIDDCINKARSGVGKVDQVAKEIRSLTASSARMKTMVDEISVGSREQSKGIEQVSRSIHNMEQVTQSNAAFAQETAAAADELTNQANLINNLVERLAELGGGAEMGKAALR